MDKLTYTLSGDDSELFTIDTDANITDQVVGQIRLVDGIKLDYDTKSTYTINVRATDPSGAYDEITVTIEVVNVDEAPAVQEVEQLRVRGDTNPTFDENQTGNVATYTATVPDGSTPTWSKSGPDSGVFSISSSGVLSIDSPLDYEAKSDANGDNVYKVTVTAAAAGDTHDVDVDVTLVNVDEDPGSIVIVTAPLVMRVGAEIRVELDEQDEESGVTWQWASGSSVTGPWTNISNATNATYTPVASDEGDYLQVTANYTDASFGSDTVSHEFTDPVAAETGPGTDGTLALSTNAAGDQGTRLRPR